MQWIQRTSVLAATLLMLASRGEAQTESAKGPVRLGVLAGANLSKVADTEGIDDMKNRLGILFGATVVVPVTQRFSVEIDALYSAKGFKVESATNDEFNSTFKLNYLEIPVLARVELGRPGAVSPHLYAGPSVAVRVGCSIEASDVSLDCDDIFEASEEEIKRVDVGMMLGGGIDVPVGRNTLSVGARYTIGVTKISGDSDGKNRAIGLYAGFSVPLSR